LDQGAFERPFRFWRQGKPIEADPGSGGIGKLLISLVPL
jgi:hypothetical protein